ncbi:hypothetical protein PVAG01_08762 [Phlyctema vagabunda]|uniref:Uncharacterized protein n=1 Tax=Phlyctema vagabunda TaxID=108571 RepID=A0ABR4PAF5_9HELO
MKPTSPLSLLIFLQWTTAIHAAPIDCLRSTSCDPALHELLTEIALSTKAHSPPPSRPIRLAEPYFPKHQLDQGLPRAAPLHPALPSPSHPSPEDAFNNAPVHPPSLIEPDTALSAQVPLQSSYLLSLSSPTHANLAAKPTSSLPSLREEDTRRYWEAILRGDKVTVEEQDNKMMSAHVDSTRVAKCSHFGMFTSIEHTTTIGWKATRAREYSDILVVGIVVLFLLAVIVVEAVEKIGDLRHAIFGSSRGAIRLEDEESIFIVKRPFHLQPAPKTRIQQRAMHEKAGRYTDDETDVDSFHYDSDANEKQ